MKKNPNNRVFDRLRSQAGFALVVTLSLMVLITLLAVALLSLSSIELRRSSTSSEMQRARSNARMGLMLAIGQLQNQLGPDRRINATANQIPFSSSNPNTTSSAAGNQHWLGVYDSWDSTLNPNPNRPSPTFRSWLISGSNSQITNREEAKNQLTPGLGVAKLWNGVLADGSDRINVPKLTIRSVSGTTNPDGACAWWIGDENAKALIRHTPKQNTVANAYANTQAAPGNSFGLNPDLASVQPDSEKLKLIASHYTLDLAAAKPGISDKLHHDFTTTSLGLATDVARGGLKRDLSLFLDHPISKPVATSLPNTNRLYPNGISWEELWLYHNIWRALESPAIGLESMTGGDLTNAQILQTPAGVGAASVTAFRRDPFSMYKLPNLIRLQWVISIMSKENGASASDPTKKKYKLYWVMDAILTYWNPYDVPIALHPDAFMALKVFSIPYDLKIKRVTGAVEQVIANNSVQYATGAGGSVGHSYTMIVGNGPRPYSITGVPDPLVLMPGEVLIMSEQSMTTTGDPLPQASLQRLGMKAGFNLGRGRSREILLLPAFSTVEFNDATPFKYSLSPNSLKAWTDNPNNGQVLSQFFYGSDVGPFTGWEVFGDRAVQLPSTDSVKNYPNIFPSPEGDIPALSAMQGGAGKHAILMFSHQVKTEDSPTSWTRFFNPHYMGAGITQLAGQDLAMSAQEVVVKPLNGTLDPNMPQLSTQINRGLFGGSFTDLERGQDTVIVQSIPREPPLSLGVFQHAIANGISARGAAGGLKAFHDSTNTYAPALSRPEISHAISNSYALPVLLPNQASSTASGSIPAYTDHSYHSNRMLWDSWFLSGIVQQQSPHHVTRRTASQVFEKFIATENPEALPNRAIKPWIDRSTNPMSKLFSGTETKSDAHEIASSMLMIEGAFNVNSTSVEAWKSMLASLDGAFMPVARDPNEPGSVSARQAKANGIAVNNLLTAFGDGGFNSAAFKENVLTTANNKDQWRGYRNLSHNEVDALAKALVVEIRKRGPFLSLADFVNRRVGNDKELALRGPLQAALDETVNKTLLSSADRKVASAAAAGFAFPEAATISKTLIGPAHVKQADILTPIGPRLTVRSDSFRIRAYGEARDKNNNITAQAWCEATVQRTPDYLDPTDPSHAAETITGRSIPTLTKNVNKSFGRRFITTSFRWINPSEIKS
jgi:Tfp pilus assembly protein PilX